MKCHLFLCAAALLLSCPPARADRAGAQKHVSTGDSLYASRDYEGAARAYGRAVEEDSSWGTAWGKRGLAKYRLSNFSGSLEDMSVAVSLEPDNREWLFQKIQTYFYLDRTAEAVDDSEALYKRWPDDPLTLAIHGRALVRAGEVDRGLELQAKAGPDVNLPNMGDGLSRKADWPALAAEMERLIAGGAPSTSLHYLLTVALVEQGAFDRAAAAVDRIGTRQPEGFVHLMSRLYLESTPAAGARYDEKLASADIERLWETMNPEGFNVCARALFLTGRVEECLAFLSTKGRRTNFDTLFWLGAASWKLGKMAEGKALLSDARRLNPYLLRHADRVPGMKEFLAAVDRELGGEKAGGADRGRLGHELATHLLTVAEIEALVRRYQFARAATEYEALLQSLKSAVRRAEVEARLFEVRAMASALARLVAAVNAARVKLKTKISALELSITKASDAGFEFTFPKGAGKFPWAFLDPAVFADFALQSGATPEEMLGLGCLAWEANARDVAAKLFEEASRKKTALRARVSAFIARGRGLAAPEDGFIYFRGQYVTAEEKQNLEKGLVAFQDQWVTPSDREKLARGLRKVGEQWLPGDDAELMRRGFRKWKGEWMSREEYEELRGRWADAWEEESAHYTIRTNQGESFAKDLAGLAEAAYAEFAAYFAAEPKLPAKEKMTLWAFRTYEDYRRHCVDTKAEDHLGAAGFARSDSNVVVGWNKTHNEQQFLQTMVHEAAHLYYFRVAPAAKAPSWYAEGLATYFEGFAWDGKKYKFGQASESRLPFVRDAMRGARHIPLRELFAGDALALINRDTQKALLFYAECWSLAYYLSLTDVKKYRDGWAEYRKAIAAGRDEPLEKFIGDLAAFEKDWVRFVTGL